MIKNERMMKWFEDNKIRESLLGCGEYFIPDITFREQHDVLLVVGQLLEWAQCGHMKEASSSFQYTIEQSELSTALKLYQAYLIAVDGEKEHLEIDEVRLRQTLVAMIQEQGDLIARNETLRLEIMRFLDRFPELKGRIGLR